MDGHAFLMKNLYFEVAEVFEEDYEYVMQAILQYGRNGKILKGKTYGMERTLDLIRKDIDLEKEKYDFDEMEEESLEENYKTILEVDNG